MMKSVLIPRATRGVLELPPKTQRSSLAIFIKWAFYMGYPQHIFVKRCAIVAFFVFSYVSANAFAQEPSSLPVGGFDVTPTLGIHVENDDNVFLEQAGSETSSTLTRITPKLSAIAGNEVTRYEITYGLEHGRYSGVENNNYTDHSLNGQISWSPSIRHMLDVLVSEARGHDERTVDTEARGNGGTTVDSTSSLDKTKERGLSANYTFGSEGARGRLTLGFTTSQLRYTTNQSTTRDLETDTDTLNAGFSVGIGANTRALLAVRRSENNFVTNNENDRKDTSYTLGVEWGISELVQAAISLGRVNNDLLNTAGDTSSSVGEASIEWAPLEHSVFTVTGNKNTENSENGVGLFVERSRFEFDWDYAVNDRFSIKTTHGRQQDTFIDANNRVDKLNESQVQFTYEFRRWMALGLTLAREKRTSTEAALDYDNNKVALFINSSL